MKAGSTIRKVLFIVVWLCIGGGMFILLMAAIESKNRDLCAGYRIRFSGPGRNLFLDAREVEAMLMKANGGRIRGALVTSFNLHELESMLEKNTWVDDAELYFDNQDVLRVSITEREPVARVFTVTGASFYIDSTGKMLPLSDKESARVPLFTGFPVNRIVAEKDRNLLDRLRRMAIFIETDPFWMSQVSQVDITPARQFEMIPVVGNHIVRLGDGEDIAARFHRLMVFYRQVLSRTGLDHYKLIDVQYRDQVVASRYAGDPGVDSIQLRHNVEKLLQQSMEAANDTVIRSMPPLVHLQDDADQATDSFLHDQLINNPEKHDPDPRLSPPTIPSGDGGQAGKDERAGKKAADKKDTVRKPKAIMPKRKISEPRNKIDPEI